MNSACTWWVLARQIVSELSINSTQTHWVNAPLPPVTAIYHKKLTFGQGYFHGQEYLRHRRIASNEERERPFATNVERSKRVFRFSSPVSMTRHVKWPKNNESVVSPIIIARVRGSGASSETSWEDSTMQEEREGASEDLHRK